ncbi:protein of unknown function [endosymbiont DhMRE of Dentiscutata heterogama]|uniref:hypothetical protein n=1 Tax=endosymbiont DhMRE of Dentiscutata heterogama TaxID=1609546 RepID=UPI000629D796|nr:hypothetical protein [endosymbiont DhMRE of Dentiscutata heterogama]CFW93223.1 protein of unknown function [endosymbiont DhMRE of Dentiscutata heterogama]
MADWSNKLNLLKERVEIVNKKIDQNPQSLKGIGEKMNQDLAELEKYLEASEEIIKREAQEQPKIEKGIDELEKEIEKLETKINTLEIQYKQLQQKTNSMKVKYGVGGTLAGVVGGIAVWKLLPKVKEWLGL